MTGLRILVVSADALFAQAAKDILAAQLPQATCDCLDPPLLLVTQAATALAIDARGGPAAAVELAARQRAMGFAGAIALIGPADDHSVAGSTRYGYALVSPHELAQKLAPELAAQVKLAESPYADQVMQARRLVAAGEVAGKLQHALNNALMGILAEAQLMQLDPLSDEHAAAIERIVALCRRMIELTRSLDGLSERKKTS